jgi:Na+/H+ antiporter NhaD/arsenite permease-like protein
MLWLGRHVFPLVVVILAVVAIARPVMGEESASVGGALHDSASVGHGEDHSSAWGDHETGHGDHATPLPHYFWALPFAALLGCIAILPLIPSMGHWWHKNRSKLLVAGTLSIVTLTYYYFRDFGLASHGHSSEPGLGTVLAVLNHAIVADYIPFIILLFSLYTISGGINLRGDIPATPKTNTLILAIGALLASLIGTTGVSMLLIRPLLQINKERMKKVHTVIFFIFLVSNIGGCLLPIGDPPLFLGYLRGVPFFWTLNLWLPWAVTVCILLAIYYVWDTIAYRHEKLEDIRHDNTELQPLEIRGTLNIAWLFGVVFAVAFMVPGKALIGTSWVVPMFFREGVQLTLAGVSMWLTPKLIRKDNQFDFFAITEVAALFVGIFICMQVPVEILKAVGSQLPLHAQWHYFWATGTLSSVLDNAPTYAVFFETATASAVEGAEGVMSFEGTAGTIHIAEALLIAISLGAVFMGAVTYIGNGPNFMVKSIAEQAKVKMPSFFGYMAYSVCILVPVFVLVTLIFMSNGAIGGPSSAAAAPIPPIPH